MVYESVDWDARKKKVTDLVAAIPYSEESRKSVINSFTYSNLSLEAIEDMTSSIVRDLANNKEQNNLKNPSISPSVDKPGSKQGAGVF